MQFSAPWLVQEEETEETWDLWRMKIEKGFSVNKVAFTMLLGGYFRMGDLVGAQNLWNDMDSRKMFLETTIYGHRSD